MSKWKYSCREMLTNPLTIVNKIRSTLSFYGRVHFAYLFFFFCSVVSISGHGGHASLNLSSLLRHKVVRAGGKQKLYHLGEMEIQRVLPHATGTEMRRRFTSIRVVVFHSNRLRRGRYCALALQELLRKRMRGERKNTSCVK